MSKEEKQDVGKSYLPKWAFLLRDAYLEYITQTNSKHGSDSEVQE
jgi:hypothetical protein